MAFETIMAGTLLEKRSRFLLLLQARMQFGLFSEFVFAIFNNKGVGVAGSGSVSEIVSLTLRGKYLHECFHAVIQSS